MCCRQSASRADVPCVTSQHFVPLDAQNAVRPLLFSLWKPTHQETHLLNNVDCLLHRMPHQECGLLHLRSHQTKETLILLFCAYHPLGVDHGGGDDIHIYIYICNPPPHGPWFYCLLGMANLEFPNLYSRNFQLWVPKA